MVHTQNYCDTTINIMLDQNVSKHMGSKDFISYTYNGHSKQWQIYNHVQILREDQGSTYL